MEFTLKAEFTNQSRLLTGSLETGKLENLSKITKPSPQDLESYDSVPAPTRMLRDWEATDQVKLTPLKKLTKLTKKDH